MISEEKKPKARRSLRVKARFYDCLHAVSDDMHIKPFFELVLMAVKQIELGLLPIASGFFFDQDFIDNELGDGLDLFSYSVFGLSLLGVLIFAAIFCLNFFRQKARNTCLNCIFYITCVICENAILIPTNVSFLRSLFTVRRTLPFDCFSVLVVNILVLLKTLFLFDMSHKSKSIERKTQGRTHFRLYLGVILATGVSQIPHVMTTFFYGVLTIAMIYEIYKFQPYFFMPANILMTVGWTNLLLMTIGLSIRKIEPRFNIYIFLVVLSLALNVSIWKWITSRSDFSIKNPYDFELHVRRMLEKAEDFPKALSLFKKYKKSFLYFRTMLLWEFHLYFDRIGETRMALNRLSAVRSMDEDFLKKWNRSIRLNKSEMVNDMFAFQIEFFYFKCLKTIEKQQQKHSIYKELDSIYYLQEYMKTEKNTLRHILNAIMSIHDNDEKETQSLEKNLKLMSSGILKMQKIVKPQLKDLNINNEIIFRYNEFYSKLLMLKNKLILQRFMINTISRTMNVNSNKSTWAISIDPETIGHVIYANKAMEQFLGTPSTELIGVHYCEYMPGPFDKLHDDLLKMFVLFGESYSISSPEFCYLSKSKHIVMAMFESYLISFNLRPLICVENIPYSKIPITILIDVNYIVLNWTAETEEHIDIWREMHIDSIFPGISSIFYQGNFSYEMYMCSLVKIEMNGKDACLLKLMHSGEEAYAKTVFQELSNEGEKLLSYIKSEPRNSESKRILTKNNRLKQKLSVNIFRLKITLKVGLLVVAACFGVYLIVERSFIDQISASKLLNYAGLLRYYSVDCTKLVRTLQLIDSGHSFQYERTYYNELLNHSSVELGRVLNELKDSLSLLAMGNSLQEIQVPVFEKLNRQVTVSSFNLEQLMMNLNAKSMQLANSDRIDRDDPNFFYVFRNGASEIVDKLTKLIDSYTVKSISHYDEIHNVNIVFSLILMVPCFVLSSIAIVLIASIERINIECWSLISSLQSCALRRLHSSVLLRLQEYHLEDESLTLESNARISELYSQIWKKPVVCILVLNLLCLVSSGILEFVFYYNIYNAMAISAEYYKHDCLRRALPNLIYFWGRESYFIEEERESYFSVVDDYSFIQSPEEETRIRMLMLRNVNKKIVFDSKFKINQEMENLMMGNACQVLDIQNCTSSIICKGLHPAVLNFLNDLEYELYKPNFKLIKMIEPYTEDIQTGFMKTMAIHEKYEDNIFQENWGRVISYCAVFFTLFIAYYMVFVFFQGEKLFDRLASRMLFIKVLSKY